MFKIRKIYCCNCGQILEGCEDKNGITKYKCSRCGCVSVARVISRRKQNVEIIAPKENN